MSRKSWEERIVGERMTADDRFAEQVTASQFSRQQWGLVMTAVEFDIEHADDEERARLVADTGKLPHVMPELDQIEQRMNAMPGGGGAGGSGGGGGIVDAVKGALGLGGGGADAEKLAAAEDLAQAYADELQSLLEERGRWDEIRRAAAQSSE